MMQEYVLNSIWIVMTHKTNEENIIKLIQSQETLTG